MATSILPPTRLVRALGFASLVIAGSACGPQGPAALTQWLGAAPHLRALGSINGETIDIDLTGAAAADPSQLWCEREYTVPALPSGEPDYAHGMNSEVRARTSVQINGQLRGLSMELKKHNFQTDAPGAQITVVPRDDLNPPTPPEMWFAWVWHDLTDNSIIFDQAAQTGTFISGEITGSVDGSGLEIAANTGQFGAFVTAQWETDDHLSMSVTANCTVNDIDDL